VDRLFPLSAFEHPTYGVVAVDARGCVRFYNRTAATLLCLERRGGQASNCWRLARLRSPDGGPFCATDCPVQREARAGAPPPSHRVAHGSQPGRLRDFELVTFLVPPARDGRFPLVHLLRPIPTPEPAIVAPTQDDPSAGGSPPPAGGVDPLSAREDEVLRLLAAGLRDEAIAARLFISPITVRNHIQRIMQKMGAHRRIEAVLAFLQKPR
jgi:DNA-binding CsgD family transcriptional regulator